MSNSYHNDHTDHTDSALRDGLRGLPVPSISPDFDARVLAGLRRPLPWWLLSWQMLRPALSAAACSLAITLIVVQWARASSPQPPKAAASTAAVKIDLLQAIDHPNVHAAYLPALMGRLRSVHDPNDPLDTTRRPSPAHTRIAETGRPWTPPSS
jgi:hypothetical protein